MQPTTDAERNASYLARPRRRLAPLRATVSEKTQLSLHLVRVTLTGPDLAGFNYPGPASHFKLVLPDPDVGELLLPTPGDDGLVTLDRTPSLIMRTYTARAFRPGVNEVDVDVFLHGDGPASTWAATVRPGDTIAVTSPRRSGFHPPESARWILLAADSSAIPAVATILEVESHLPIRCVIEVDDARAVLNFHTTPRQQWSGAHVKLTPLRTQPCCPRCMRISPQAPASAGSQASRARYAKPGRTSSPATDSTATALSPAATGASARSIIPTTTTVPTWSITHEEQGTCIPPRPSAASGTHIDQESAHATDNGRRPQRGPPHAPIAGDPRRRPPRRRS